MDRDIIEKIKNANLLGRGGAAFPAWQKWESVKSAHGEKYIVANGSEGEPGVFKDKYILEHYGEEFINGLKIALEFFVAKKAIVYLNHEYYKQFASNLKKIAGNLPIEIFEKKGAYIGGEETAMLNTIEGQLQEPRFRPPFPTQKGLYGQPTLVHNIETLYYISRIAQGQYKGTRFYSLSGAIANPGVFELPLDYTIEQILKETKNFPVKAFFVQSGGGASGAIYTQKDLKRQVEGSGSITVYDGDQDLYELMAKWARFFSDQNCDKCTPCREGSKRLVAMFESRKINTRELHKIFDALDKTSFCPLGKYMSVPFKTLIAKLLP